MERLALLVGQFRAAMENLNPIDFCGTSLSDSKFPDGCCDDSSQLLAAYLSDNGYPSTQLIRGVNGGVDKNLNSHVWLYLDGVHIDITSDQFNEKGYENPPVIIAYHNDFLSSFEIQNSGPADFRIHLKRYSSPGLECEFNSCYETVLDYLSARKKQLTAITHSL